MAERKTAYFLPLNFYFMLPEYLNEVQPKTRKEQKKKLEKELKEIKARLLYAEEFNPHKVQYYTFLKIDILNKLATF